MATRSIPQGTMAQALASVVPQVETVKGYAYYDLMEHIDELVSHPLLKARIKSALAWRVDTLIVSLARSMFFDMYKEQVTVGTIDSYNDFITAVAERKQDARAIYDLGFEERSEFEIMPKLLDLSLLWHDQAQSAFCAAGNSSYEARSLRQLIDEEEVQAVDKLSLSKLRDLAEDLAEGDKVEEAELLADLVERQKMANMSSFENRRRTTPAVLEIIDAVQRVCYIHNNERRFDEIPLDIQVKLIEFAKKTLDTTVTKLAVYTSISVFEYAGMRKERKVAQVALSDALNAPKYNEGTATGTHNTVVAGMRAHDKLKAQYAQELKQHTNDDPSRVHAAQ